MEEYKEYFDANKELWDARVKPHVNSKMYDVEGFKNGKSSLTQIEIDTLGDLSGQEALHLQCHFGLDTMSLCRLGASKAVGIDISDEAVSQGRLLADELQINAEFVSSNVYDIGKLGEFDLVFTSFGATPWLPDLKTWASLINLNLKPGGTFYICEFHPLIYIFDFETKDIKYDYFYTKEPIVEEPESSYTDNSAMKKMKEYSWNHGVSEILSPLLGEGLQLQKIQEYDYSPYNCFPNMQTVGVDKYRYSLGIRFPHILEMVFRKPEN